MKHLFTWLSLFASTGTLLCCALPSLLVALGLGASIAGLITAVPELIWLSQYKFWVFAASGMMLTAVSGLYFYTRNQPCPIEPNQARACQSSRLWSFRILAFSVLIWLTGAFFAFVAPLML